MAEEEDLSDIELETVFCVRSVFKNGLMRSRRVLRCTTCRYVSSSVRIVVISFAGRRKAMKQKTEREWKSIICPEGRGKTMLICEWDIVSGERTLKQIDCHNPKLSEFGGIDCRWECEKGITSREY